MLDITYSPIVPVLYPKLAHNHVTDRQEFDWDELEMMARMGGI